MLIVVYTHADFHREIIALYVQNATCLRENYTTPWESQSNLITQFPHSNRNICDIRYGQYLRTCEQKAYNMCAKQKHPTTRNAQRALLINYTRETHLPHRIFVSYNRSNNTRRQDACIKARVHARKRTSRACARLF